MGAQMSDDSTRDENSIQPSEQRACDANLTRHEFLKRAAKTVVGGSAAVLGVRILDKFLVPPAYAYPSGGSKMTAPAGMSDYSRPGF